MTRDLETRAGLIRKYDAVCKEILSQKRILAWIMKECMTEYERYSVEEIAHRYIENDLQVSSVLVDEEWMPQIQGANVEDSDLREGRVTYDIRFTATVPETGRRIWIDIEPQKNFRPGYSLLKRGIYYLARLISSQREREFVGDDYDKLKKVYVVWICLKPPKRWEHKIKYYEIRDRDNGDSSLFQLKDYDLMTQIVICLGEPKESYASGVSRLLSVLFTNAYDISEKQKILETEFGIIATDDMRKGMKLMCNFGEGIYEEGIERGIDLGKKTGASNVNLLYRLLTSEKRFDELQRAIEDDTYLDQLLYEYSLA